MEVREAIGKRRSIRVYAPEAPSREQLEALMDAAFDAPSGGNEQNWHFSVITDPELLAELEVRGAEAGRQYGPEKYKKMLSTGTFRVLHQAPCVILACYDPEKRNGEVDCYLAAANISLAALPMGLGTCMVALIDFLINQAGDEDLRRRCGVPEGYQCALAITVGTPKQDPKPRPRDRTKLCFVSPEKR